MNFQENQAVEFRQYLLYTGLVVFKKFTSDSYFQHYLLLSCSYRIFMQSKISKREIFMAHEMLVQFVEQFSKIYGETGITHNVHNLLHLKEIALQYRSLSEITAYPFENALSTLKRAIKKPQHIEQQMVNVFSNLPLIKTPGDKGIKRGANGNVIWYKYKDFCFTTKLQDSFCIIHNDTPVKIIEFIENDMFKAHVFINTNNMFLEPMGSKDLGIYVINLHQYNEETFKLEEISNKLFCLPYEHFLLISFAHSF